MLSVAALAFSCLAVNVQKRALGSVIDVTGCLRRHQGFGHLAVTCGLPDGHQLEWWEAFQPLQVIQLTRCPT